MTIATILSLDQYTAFRRETIQWLSTHMNDELYRFNMGMDISGTLMNLRMLMIGGQVMRPEPETWFTEQARDLIAAEFKWPPLIFVARMSSEWVSLNLSSAGSDRIDRRFYSVAESAFTNYAGHKLLSPVIAPREVIPDFGNVGYEQVLGTLGFRGGVLEDMSVAFHARPLLIKAKVGVEVNSKIPVRGGVLPYTYEILGSHPTWVGITRDGNVRVIPPEGLSGITSVIGLRVRDATNEPRIISITVIVE